MKSELINAKVGALFTGLGTLGGWSQLNLITLPVVGVPATAVGCAAFGVMVSFAWFDHEEMSRRKLFLMAAGATFLGSVTAAILPHAMDLKWALQLQGPIAGISGLAMLHFMPPALKRGKELISTFSPMNWFKKGD